jgi:molybdenum cofactor cytidylyltransferase
VQALDLRDGDLVALVGGGGKSSLLFALGTAFPRPTVMTTTTRIFSAQSRLAPCLTMVELAQGEVNGRDRMGELLAVHGRCLIIGDQLGEKAAGVPPELPAQWLARTDVSLVVVEADGSRMRPIKAPAEHEPVIPEGTTLLIAVAGIDALGRPVEQAAHRPERFCGLTGLQPRDVISEEAMVVLLTHPAGGRKGLPESARFMVVINKVESAQQRVAGRRVAKLILRSARVQRVVLLSLRGGRVVDVVE